MQAIKILWKVTPRNYANPIGGVDYQILASNLSMPSADPQFDPTLANPEEELLIMATINNNSTPDMRVYRTVQNIAPTNQKNSFFVKVNEFQTTTNYVFKSLDELISSINQREIEANTKVRLESNFDKLSMVNSPIMAKFGTVTLTDVEQKIYDRTMEVQARTIANDENARRLIEVSKYNDTASEGSHQAFDINSGWQEDGITLLDIPFNELFA